MLEVELDGSTCEMELEGNVRIGAGGKYAKWS